MIIIGIKIINNDKILRFNDVSIVFIMFVKVGL